MQARAEKSWKGLRLGKALARRRLQAHKAPELPPGCWLTVGGNKPRSNNRENWTAVAIQVNEQEQRRERKQRKEGTGTIERKPKLKEWREIQAQAEDSIYSPSIFGRAWTQKHRHARAQLIFRQYFCKFWYHYAIWLPVYGCRVAEDMKRWWRSICLNPWYSSGVNMYTKGWKFNNVITPFLVVHDERNTMTEEIEWVWTTKYQRSTTWTFQSKVLCQ